MKTRKPVKKVENIVTKEEIALHEPSASQTSVRVCLREMLNKNLSVVSIRDDLLYITLKS